MDELLRGMDEPAAKGLTLSGEQLPEFVEPIGTPHGTTPLRPRASVRRTMSIDVHWPEGVTAASHYDGRARDVVTNEASTEPVLLRMARVAATTESRKLLSISAEPTPPRLQELVGVRAGGHLRAALENSVPLEKAAGTPLYLLLDDLAGATLVSAWAMSLWREDWLKIVRRSDDKFPVMQGICIGFRPGSSALDDEGRSRRDQNVSKVVPLPNPADPLGWHEMPDYPQVNFRRARRIDVWREGGELKVESHFQDSARAPDGGRRAVHEYMIHATIDVENRLKELTAVPGTLPYASCRSAPANLEVLLGTPVSELRDKVLEQLKFTAGCTHLNDMVRSLAEVPILARDLPPNGG